MRHHTHKGQSIVEMALLLPLMLVVIMGIIDFGWYVYGYATVYMATRAAAEEATMAPPSTDFVGVGKVPDMSDNCVSTVANRIVQTAPLFPDLADAKNIEISYPDVRAPGESVQVKLTYGLRPLTPLWQMVPVFGKDGVIKISIANRRTIEVLGLNPSDRYAGPNLTVCEDKPAKK